MDLVQAEQIARLKSEEVRKQTMSDEKKKKDPTVVRIHVNFATYLKYWVEVVVFAMFFFEALYAAYLGSHFGVPGLIRVGVHSTQAFACIFFSIAFFSIIRQMIELGQKIDKKNKQNQIVGFIRLSSLFIAVIVAGLFTYKGPWTLFNLISSMATGVDQYTGMLFPNGATLVVEAAEKCGWWLNTNCWVDVLSANPFLPAPFGSVVFHYALLIILLLQNSDVLLLVKNASASSSKGGGGTKKPKKRPNSGGSGGGNSGGGGSGSGKKTGKVKNRPKGGVI